MAQTPYAYLESHRDEILDELVAFTSIPSVSADPHYRPDVEKAARWVADRLKRAGLDRVRLFSTEDHPVVFGEWVKAPGAPTVLIHGHYDVQPPGPAERWVSDPFQPTIRKGRLYGRGVADGKGPLIIPIKTVEAFLTATGRLPVNVRFLIEGDEEGGHWNLGPFIREHAEMLRADFVLSTDGAMWRHDEPSLTVGCRGFLGLELAILSGSKDLHSGRHGGCVANAAVALARLIASLHDDNGRVAVAGFYDDVVELSADERQAIAAIPFDEARYLRENGSPALCGEAGYSLLERQWTRPALDVNGMWGGYLGQGGQTVIPADAHAKISCRLVPNQDPQAIARLVERHLEARLLPGVRVQFGEVAGGLPYRVPPDHVGLRVAAEVLEQVYRKPPVTVRMGATVAVCEVFRQDLGLETVFFSFATADDDYHAPNEFFRLNRLYEGLEAWTRYFERLAAARKKDRQ
ncbi:MAG TPA: dipeptidase [Vicinamibacterales bacterium]|jgi:acetylornithine deacetylase/succinyl-diaminopimelate desuccinylase-like protein